LVQVFYAVCVFIQQLALARYRLPSLDEIEKDNWSPIALEEVIEVTRGRCEERINNAD
jgi:hypothetical protein